MTVSAIPCPSEGEGAQAEMTADTSLTKRLLVGEGDLKSFISKQSPSPNSFNFSWNITESSTVLYLRQKEHYSPLQVPRWQKHCETYAAEYFRSHASKSCHFWEASLHINVGQVQGTGQGALLGAVEDWQSALLHHYTVKTCLISKIRSIPTH